MKAVLVMFKGQDRRDFPLTRESTRIGRRTDCHLRIPTQDVSRQHCDLIQRNGRLLVKDLGSSNGTYVNGKRVAESTLRPGDKLRIGPVTFVVQIDGQPAKIEPEPGAQTSPAAPAPAPAPPPKDEATFELGDADLDADEPIETLDEWEDEKGMP